MKKVKKNKEKSTIPSKSIIKETKKNVKTKDKLIKIAKTDKSIFEECVKCGSYETKWNMAFHLAFDCKNSEEAQKYLRDKATAKKNREDRQEKERQKMVSKVFK